MFMIYEIGLTLEKIPFKKFIEFYMPLRRSQLAINNKKKKKKKFVTRSANFLKYDSCFWFIQNEKKGIKAKF